MKKHAKTQANASASRPRYVELLETVKRLKTEAKTLLFERVSCLVELFHDADYREKLRQGTADGLVDDLLVDAVLDEYVDDTDFGFGQLRKIRQTFPDVADWQSRKLIDLWEEASRRTEPDAAAHKTPRRVIKRAEFEAKEAEADAWRAKAAVLEDRCRQGQQVVERTLSRVEQLESENQELRRQVARLEAENRELRRQLTEPMVAVA